MQKLDRKNDLSCVKDHFGQLEPLLALEVLEKCAAALVAQHKIQVGAALERIVQFEDERVIQGHQDLLLQLDVAEVVLLLQDALVQHLHGVVPASAIFLVLLHQEHLRETSLTEQTNHADRPQIYIRAEVFNRIGATGLHYIVEQTDTLLQLLFIPVALQRHLAIS